MTRRLAGAVVLVALWCAGAAAETFYVDGLLGNDGWDGRCPTCDPSGCGPKRTIQAGIAAAANGDLVLVADGVYTGDGNRDIDFLGKAITLRATNGPANCIVDCQGSAQSKHRGFRIHLQETAAAVLDGFTIQNGYAPDEGSPCNYSGGGILCRDNSNPTIRNCVVRANVTNAY